MQTGESAQFLSIHVSEDDRFEDKPLYEAIVSRCRELKIAGATVFRGLPGNGGGGEIEKPVVVMIVDSSEALKRLMPVIETMMDTGVLELSNVQAVRIQKPVL